MNEHRIDSGALFVAFVLAIKFLVIAFMITPLWDIPDEFAHVAYIIDLSDGGSLPLLGDSRIPAYVLEHVFGTAEGRSSFNWIVQHPPAFHFVATLPLIAASFLSSNQDIIFLSPRIISVLFSIFSFLVLYKTTLKMTDNRTLSLSLSLSLFSTPMISHLSGGANHDIFLLSMCSLATLSFANFMIERRLRYLYFTAFFLTMACATKTTAWVLLPPLLAFMAVEYRASLHIYFMHGILVGLIALSAPILWMARNFYHFGTPIIAAKDLRGNSKQPLEDQSYFDYASQFPVYDELQKHYIGLFGWMGNGTGRLLDVSGSPLVYYSLLITLVAITLHIFIFSRANTAKHNLAGILKRKRLPKFPLIRYSVMMLNRANFYIGSQIFFCASLFGFLLAKSTTSSADGAVLRVVSSILLFTSGVGALFVIFERAGPRERFIKYSLIIFTFFSFVLLTQLYGVYVSQHRYGAIHGRYFFPMLPFLVVALSVVLNRFSFANPVAVIIAINCVVIEAYVFFDQVIPFYER